MKFSKITPHETNSWTIPEYLAYKLTVDRERVCLASDEERHRTFERTTNLALGRLCDVLAENDLISAQDLQYIAEDFRGEPHQVKFIKG